MTEENTKKAKVEIISINGENYYTLHKAADVLSISERSLSRECSRRNIRYAHHLKGLVFHPSWCDEWLQKRITEPKKSVKLMR